MEIWVRCREEERFRSDRTVSSATESTDPISPSEDDREVHLIGNVQAGAEEAAPLAANESSADVSNTDPMDTPDALKGNKDFPIH